MIDNKPLSKDPENDRVLRTYSITNKKFICFDASGFFSPISIRDQIIRVCLIVERAHYYGIISTNRPLLIVGGGPAGATAAIKAAELKVPTVLIDHKTLLEGLSKSIRVFSPIQYDWPVRHWREEVFPWEYEPSYSIPVFLHEGPVQDTISNLETLFTDLIEEEERKEKKDRFLNYYEYVELGDCKPSDDLPEGEKFPLLTIDFKKAPAEEVKENLIILPEINSFGMGLSCIGFGKERVCAKRGDFRGYTFWSFVHHSRFLKDGNVLICGSGDGALQDFLLLATEKQTAKEMYQYLRDGEPQVEKHLFEKLEEGIRNAEEEAKRDEIWQNNTNELNKNNLCRIHRNLHIRHQEEVDKLLDSAFIKNKLESIVVAEALEGKLQLTHICNHFSGCYALNRFLTLLIGNFIHRNSGQSVFLEKTSVVEVESLDEKSHTCGQEDEVKCDRFPHRVYLADKSSCTNINNTSSSSEIFRHIIIRYGIDKTIRIFKEYPAFPGIQILPYTLP